MAMVSTGERSPFFQLKPDFYPYPKPKNLDLEGCGIVFLIWSGSKKCRIPVVF
jgi:hypothetical protein